MLAGLSSAAGDPAYGPKALGGRPRVRRTPLRAAAARRVSWLTNPLRLSGCIPRSELTRANPSAVGQAGGVLMGETLRSSGLDQGLSAGLAPWREASRHSRSGQDHLRSCAVVGVGGDCLADVGVLRSERGVCDRIASDDRLPHDHRAGR
jgi:hypothetical protein